MNTWINKNKLICFDMLFTATGCIVNFIILTYFIGLKANSVQFIIAFIVLNAAVKSGQRLLWHTNHIKPIHTIIRTTASIIGLLLAYKVLIPYGFGMFALVYVLSSALIMTFAPLCKSYFEKII